MSSEIVPFRYNALDLGIKFEVPSELNLSLQPLKVIYNAWCRGSKIDSYGRIWICQSELHNILRTTKDNATYIGLLLDDKYKINIGEEIYIQGSEVCRLLDDIIQSAGSIKREKYARFSDTIYRLIRDSDTTKTIRYEYYEAIQCLKKKLKKTRIKKLKLEKDELTDFDLKKNSEFSHIRGAQLYLNLADKYWNGLIVNKETHEIITKRAINDEDQLFNLCMEYNWNTEWYSVFCQCLNSI